MVGSVHTSYESSWHVYVSSHSPNYFMVVCVKGSLFPVRITEDVGEGHSKVGIAAHVIKPPDKFAMLLVINRVV